MPKQSGIVSVFLLLVLVLSASACAKFPESVNPVITVYAAESTPAQEPESTAGYGDEIPITRGLVCKMLAMSFSDKQSIDLEERQINFTDTKIEDWYDRFINAAYLKGMVSGYGEAFKPESPLTLEEAQQLLIKINPDNKIKISLNDDNRDKAISYALWVKLFYQTLEAMSENKVFETYGISKKNLVVLASTENNNRLKEWHAITDTGAISHLGQRLGMFLDKQIEVIIKDGELIAVTEVTSNSPTLKNAYITKTTKESITVFSGGAERTYRYNAAQDIVGKICNITISGQYAVNVEVFSQVQSGTVKKTSEGGVELKNIGEVKMSDDIKIYSVADGPVKLKDIRNVIVGADISEYYIENNEIIAIVINKKPAIENIRVLINNTGYKSAYHQTVRITSDAAFTVKSSNRETLFEAGETFELTDLDSDYFSQTAKRIYITPNKGGKLRLESITRAWPDNTPPEYRGVFEISAEAGGFLVVNELPFEEYLYSVVPSEMPSSYGAEASKVQAITARSYAYTQYYSNRYHQYGANIDDSVICQVYNNIPENEISIKAVDGTAGQYLTYNGEVVAANYFSTSSGVTANANEVWASSLTGEFPVQNAPYLSSVKQYEGSFGDLREEAIAADFLKDKSVEAYDSNAVWFRWSVIMTAKQLEASINHNIAERYSENNRLVKTQDENGKLVSESVSTIGRLMDIEVEKRGEGGNVMQLRITGADATVVILTELNIRSLLKPINYLQSAQDVIITRGDGSTLANYQLLPSAFFVIEKMFADDGSLESVTFHGGGNGHGVGMSQNGVKGMIDKGFKAAEVLMHYYPEAEVKNIV